MVWADSDLDLAIVKVSVSDLNYITLGDSDNIKIGEKAYAIGNPIGVEFQRTVTSGIISGVNITTGENKAIFEKLQKEIIEQKQEV